MLWLAHKCTDFKHRSFAIRVLGVARFWRVVRLLRDSVAQIEESHQETLQLLEEQGIAMTI